MIPHGTRTELLDAVVSKGARIAELGVFRGEFAEEIVARCQPSELHLVDLWDGYQSSGDKDGANIQRVDMRAELARLEKKYASAPGVHLHQRSIMDFLTSREDNSLDAVYIDGDHTYGNVQEEIREAARVVRDGGWIMGHDLNVNGVRYAVFEFCEDHGLRIAHAATDGCPSYAIQMSSEPVRPPGNVPTPAFSAEDKNVRHLKNVIDELDKLGVKAFLAYGTALFAIRDGCVSHYWDSDMDIGVWAGSVTSEVIAGLQKRFRCRKAFGPGWWSRGDFVRLLVATAKGEPSAQDVDIFAFGKCGGSVYTWMQYHSYHKIPEAAVGEATLTTRVGGVEFRIPDGGEAYLEAVYGPDWGETKKHIAWRTKHKCWVTFGEAERLLVRKTFNIK